MADAVKKCSLAVQLNFFRDVFPKQFKSFVPLTWVLPRDAAAVSEYLAARKGRTVIIKPDAGSQGDGILLTQRPRDVPTTLQAVAQKYVASPMTLEGVKFDMRLYVLVTSVAPLRAYIHHVGMVRLATQEYVKPDASNLNHVFKHLTNYSINKMNTEFEFNTDATQGDKGSKRLLDPVFAQLKAEGRDTETMWTNIKALVAKTLVGMGPTLWAQYCGAAPKNDAGCRCFQILGFDVLLDNKGKPWLLEVNNSPSLATETPLDELIKRTVVTDTFKIVDLTPEERAAWLIERRSRTSVKKTSPVRGRGSSPVKAASRAARTATDAPEGDATAEDAAENADDDAGPADDIDAIVKANVYDPDDLRELRTAFELNRAAKTGFEPIFHDDEENGYDDLVLFQSNELLHMYRQACGIRYTTMTAGKFTKFFRSCGVSTPAFNSHDADILYITVARQFGVSEMTYLHFCLAFVRAAQKMYPSDTAIGAATLLIENFVRPTYDRLLAASH
eukprot:TRINITY_DN1115_c0_g1_i3.p1 TRINITY_DN1115_c0_g1~~TRINITY_DN1115_c0_g1_i3.p1  ORF type:complete len:503 (-),score=132.82 TRINITY_DN1115_c0_g1_i3:488-1996(-)